MWPHWGPPSISHGGHKWTCRSRLGVTERKRGQKGPGFGKVEKHKGRQLISVVDCQWWYQRNLLMLFCNLNAVLFLLTKFIFVDIDEGHQSVNKRLVQRLAISQVPCNPRTFSPPSPHIWATSLGPTWKTKNLSSMFLLEEIWHVSFSSSLFVRTTPHPCTHKS